MAIKRLTDFIVGRNKREIINWNFDNLLDTAVSLETTKVPCTGDARLLEMDIHYQIDTVGSRLEHTK